MIFTKRFAWLYFIFAILVFVGCKMVIEDFYHVSITASLAVIILVLTVSIVCSWLWPQKSKEKI